MEMEWIKPIGDWVRRVFSEHSLDQVTREGNDMEIPIEYR